MKFYLFRHGQTDWNNEKRIQGHSNIPLNEEGRVQALKLRDVISSLNLDIIYSSDLDRAFETATISSQGLNIEIVKEKRLREASFGKAEGMLLADIIKEFGEASWQRFMKLDRDHLDACFPEGETRRSSIERMRSVIDEVISSGKYQRVGISTHGGVVRNLLGSYLMDSDPGGVFDIPIPNCVIYELSVKEGKFSISGPIS